MLIFKSMPYLAEEEIQGSSEVCTNFSNILAPVLSSSVPSATVRIRGVISFTSLPEIDTFVKSYVTCIWIEVNTI